MSDVKPYFNSVERLLKLQSVAESWRGTPFMPNAAIKGAGVSCQKLVSEIFIETGALPKSFSVPDGPMNWSHAHKDSLIEKFMATQTEFFTEGFNVLAAGDMIGIQIGGCVHHCGIILNGSGFFIHCLRPHGVLFNNAHDATYLGRIKKIWHPIER